MWPSPWGRHVVYVCMWGWGRGSKDFASKNEVKKKSCLKLVFGQRKMIVKKIGRHFFSTLKKFSIEKYFVGWGKIFEMTIEKISTIENFSMTEKNFRPPNFFGGFSRKLCFFDSYLTSYRKPCFSLKIMTFSEIMFFRFTMVPIWFFGYRDFQSTI